MSDNNLPKIKIDAMYDDIDYSFQESIKLNEDLREVIEDVYKLALLNMGKVALSNFHLKYIGMFDKLVNKSENNQELYNLSSSLSSSINSYFLNLNSNLYIKDKTELIKLKNILEVSLILMEGVIEDNDVDLAYESFFQIKRRIKKGNFYKKPITS